MKTLSIFFGCLLCMLGVSQAMAAQNFSDVSDTHKNKTAIEYLQKNGVLQGYEDGRFKPSQDVNRAEMSKILVEGNGVSPSADEYQNCFPDVTNQWFAKYVCYAKAKGWVQGYPDGTFKPERTILKVESIKMLLNARGIDTDENQTSTGYEDINTNEWYAPYVAKAKSLNLLEETGSTLSPAQNMSRGKTAEFLYRILTQYNSKTYLVSRVIDGDTVKIYFKGEITSVRMIWIDAPENSSYRYWHSECYGRESKQYLEWVIDNNPIILEFDETQWKQDKYWRLLAYLKKTDGTNINKKMIQKWYAYEYTYNIPYYYQDEFIQAEKQAKENEQWLWNPKTCKHDQ